MKASPENWLNPEKGKQAGGYPSCCNPRGFPESREFEVVVSVCCHALKGLLSLLVKHQIRYGKRDFGKPKTWNALMHRYQFPGIVKGKRAQQDSIDHAEHGSIDADAQRQSQHRHRGKGRLPAQDSESVAHVLEHTAHACTSAMSFFSSSSATTLPSNRCTSR